MLTLYLGFSCFNVPLDMEIYSIIVGVMHTGKLEYHASYCSCAWGIGVSEIRTVRTPCRNATQNSVWISEIVLCLYVVHTFLY